MVLQDAWLFHGTIYENLTYGRENITRKEVEQAAKAAMIYSYIEKLPEGFETVLSDNGVHIGRGDLQCGYKDGNADTKGHAQSYGG